MNVLGSMPESVIIWTCSDLLRSAVLVATYKMLDGMVPLCYLV